MSTRVYLQGGLGNQLFQLSAALRIRQKYTRRRVQLCPSLLEQASGEYQRDFSIKPLLARDEVVFRSPPSTFVTKVLHRVKILDFENQQENNVDEYCRYRTRHLIGYFQNVTTVDSVWADLSSRLQVTPKFSKLFESSQNSYIAVHVRLGDYQKKSEAERVHGVCSIDYYVRAICLLAKESGFTEIKIVSDDIAETKKMFAERQDLQSYRIEYVEKQDEIDDLVVLAQASGVVMSNSTFSWWGAYISYKQRKTGVIYPNPWFVDPEFKTQCLFPLSWQKIDR